MDRRFLEELGLEKETIDKVMLEHGKTVNETKAKAEKVDTLESQIEDYEKQIEDRDKQLEDLSKKAQGNEELSEELNRLKEENQKTADEWKQKLEQQQKSFAIQSALRDANAHDPDLVQKAIDTDAVSFKDGKLIGIDEQLNDLKENKSFLFKQEEPAGLKGRQPHINNEPPKGVTRDDLNKMTYKERVQFKQENPDQYNQLIKGE